MNPIFYKHIDILWPINYKSDEFLQVISLQVKLKKQLSIFSPQTTLLDEKISHLTGLLTMDI